MVELYKSIVAVPKLVYDYVELIGPDAAGSIITERVIEEIKKLENEQGHMQEEDPNRVFNWVHDTILGILESGPKSRTGVINELIYIKKSNRIRLGEIAGYKFYAQTMDAMRSAGELLVTGINTGTRWRIA